MNSALSFRQNLCDSLFCFCIILSSAATNSLHFLYNTRAHIHIAADRTRLNSFLGRCVKLGYYSSNDAPTISSTADDVEGTLFKSILRNAQHVLQPYLDERPQLHYNLRNRPGINKTLMEKTVDLNDRDFLVRNLFKVSY